MYSTETEREVSKFVRDHITHVGIPQVFGELFDELSEAVDEVNNSQEVTFTEDEEREKKKSVRDHITHVGIPQVFGELFEGIIEYINEIKGVNA